ncbi:MAG: HAD family phosphatase [Blautia sp.]|nr:HAD family phosphatase [Blautia sp.]MCM1202407.1 HAD family phosphatase [Bacteroides fragilis]
MEKKTVIFDMDGVIFDSEQLVLDSWEKVGEKYGLKDVVKVLTDCIGTSIVRTREIIYAHYGKDFDYERYGKEASALFHEYVRENGLPVKKGVRELLQYLKEEEVPVGLASSTRLAVVEEELKQAGLYAYFQVVIGGDQLKRSKPEPDIYLMACEKMGVSPENAYAVEDSYNGIRAAHSAGMMPVMVPDILPATEEMREKSIAVFEDLFQVKQFLGGKS